MKIGLLSDTHGHLDERFFSFFKDCDELWHAGDIGTIDLADRLTAFKPCLFVHGNIDGSNIRSFCPQDLVFEREGIRIFMTHIAGYPGKYNSRVKKIIDLQRPGMLICGHSHILKVIYDQNSGHLHLNPGAAGIQGWHKLRTALRFNLENGKPSAMEIFELPKGGKEYSADPVE
jgi:putative phosphoesterase